MNTSMLVAKRAAPSICLSCRKKSLLRQLSSSGRRTLAKFQSYRLNPHPLSPPRSASGPDASITDPIESPIPQLFETRPPQISRSREPAVTSIPSSVREDVAQRSQADVAPAQASSSGLSPQLTSSQNEPANTFGTATHTEKAFQSEPTLAPKPRPRAKLRVPRKAAMKITPAAVQQLRALLDLPEPKFIKVGVRNRGCSGLAYHLEYVDKPGAFDETVEQDGVKVLIDSKALFSIIGSEMDWVEDKLNERFVFRNPNIKEQCGCGESFMI